ncbi:MAG TPA: hypothetical protein VKB62_04585 [Streptosporangiaceae bacterium]|nr:hypothetical protein [Streptosporangiaceae bacterium]
MASRSEQRTKRCASCGGSYLLEFFRLDGSAGLPSKPDARLYRARCIGCEAIRKRSELINQRFRRKAVATRRRHAARLKDLGVLGHEDDLEKLYGWSTDRMVQDIQRVREYGCPYCLQPVNTAEHGMGIITLAILDDEQPPYYSGNVLWCCTRCNSEKQRISAETWEARQSMWNLWRLNQIRLGIDPESLEFLRLNEGRLTSQLRLW